MGNHKFYPRNILQSIIFICLFFAIGAFFLFLSNIVGFKDILKSRETSGIFVFVYSLVFIFIFHIRNVAKGVNMNYGFKLKSISAIPLMLIILFVFHFGLLSPVFDGLLFQSDNANQQNPFNSVLYIFSVLILAPVLEEIIFRGFILKGLLLTYSATKAIVISAILFGLIHVNVVHIDVAQIIIPICMGLFLGWIYYRTRSLGLCAVLHSFANLLGLTVSYLNNLLRNSKNNLINDLNDGIYWCILFCALLIMLFLLNRLNKKMEAISRDSGKQKK